MFPGLVSWVVGNVVGEIFDGLLPAGFEVVDVVEGGDL